MSLSGPGAKNAKKVFTGQKRTFSSRTGVPLACCYCVYFLKDKSLFRKL